MAEGGPAEPRTVLVTGNWNDLELFQGNCQELGHVRKDSDTVPVSVLEEPYSEFIDLLKSSAPGLVSIQLGSRKRLTIEQHAALLDIIGRNCPQLQCLSVNLPLIEEELEKQKALTLNDYEGDPETRAAWTSFVSSVSSTFQDISFGGDYNIPLFAMKLLLEKCPNLRIIDGGMPDACTLVNQEGLILTGRNGKGIRTPNDIPMLTNEQAGLVIFVDACRQNALKELPPGSEIRLDLEALIFKCTELRTLWFDWDSSMDLMLFEHENMQKLVDLEIANGGDEIEYLAEKEASKPLEPIDLLIPLNSSLRSISFRGSGIPLSQRSFECIAERAPSLRALNYIAPGEDTVLPTALIELARLKSIRYLFLDVTNSLSHSQIVPFLLTLAEGLEGQEIYLAIKKIRTEDEAKIKEDIEEIVSCFHSIENGVSLSLDLQYPEYAGNGRFAFEFSKDYERLERMTTESKSVKYRIPVDNAVTHSLELFGKEYFDNMAASGHTCQC